jgi:hypothetical protein
MINERLIHMRFYDVQGEEITQGEWSRMFRAGKRDVARDLVGSDFMVSTVWLGLDHRSLTALAEGGDLPVIFETMVFPRKPEGGGGRGGEDGTDWSERFYRRYSTLEEAKEGHLETVEMVRSGGLDG